MALKAKIFASSSALILLAACKLSTETSFEVFVSDERGPVSGAQIFVDGTLQAATDSSGKAAFSAKSQGESFSIYVTDPSIKTLRMPRSLELPTERPLFEKAVSLNVKLKDVPLVFETPEHQNALATPPTRFTNIVEENLPEPTVAPTQPILEQQVVVEVPTASPDTAIPSEQSKTETSTEERLKTEAVPVAGETSPTVAPTEVPNLNLKDEPLLDFNISSFLEGAPVAKAAVFIGRNGQRSLSYLGSTNEQGELSIALPKSFRGESILVRHECCVPQMRPLTTASGISNVRVELNRGVGDDFVASQFAYGVARGIEGVQLFNSTGQIDTANQIGFTLASGKWVSENYTLRSKEMIPNELEVEGNKSKITSSKTKVHFVAATTAPKPTIAVYEDLRGLGENPAEHPQWRRFRRDFQARFLQTSVVRPIISTEFERLAREIQLSPETLSRSGWEFTPLREFADALVILRVMEDVVHFEVRDRTSREIVKSQQLPLDKPEESGKTAFQNLISQFPFEGSITSKTEGSVHLNFGSRSGRALQVGQKFVFLSNKRNTLSPPTTPVCFGNVASVSDVETRVTLNEVLEKEFCGPGALALRLNETIQGEFPRVTMAKKEN